jgi:hypothetical protein
MQPFTPLDCAGRGWWSKTSAKDSDTDVHARIKGLWTQLRFGPAAESDASILVGHSFFFRAMLQQQLGQAFKKANPVRIL